VFFVDFSSYRTFQEVDWHRVWKGEFGMPTTKVKKSKSK
jgi:hypothetical protein